jgi:hypothetical protein
MHTCPAALSPFPVFLPCLFFSQKNLESHMLAPDAFIDAQCICQPCVSIGPYTNPWAHKQNPGLSFLALTSNPATNWTRAIIQCAKVFPELHTLLQSAKHWNTAASNYTHHPTGRLHKRGFNSCQCYANSAMCVSSSM